MGARLSRARGDRARPRAPPCGPRRRSSSPPWPAARGWCRRRSRRRSAPGPRRLAGRAGLPALRHLRPAARADARDRRGGALGGRRGGLRARPERAARALARGDRRRAEAPRGAAARRCARRRSCRRPSSSATTRSSSAARAIARCSRGAGRAGRRRRCARSSPPARAASSSSTARRSTPSRAARSAISGEMTWDGGRAEVVDTQKTTAGIDPPLRARSREGRLRRGAEVALRGRRAAPPRHPAQPHRDPSAARRAAPGARRRACARRARWSRPTACASTSPTAGR